VLTVQQSFPYLTRRLLVTDKREQASAAVDCIARFFACACVRERVCVCT
jgi:hypothetical protein